jgi:hypothetical protein
MRKLFCTLLAAFSVSLFVGVNLALADNSMDSNLSNPVAKSQTESAVGAPGNTAYCATCAANTTGGNLPVKRDWNELLPDGGGAGTGSGALGTH